MSIETIAYATRRARKVHRCGMCTKRIEIGELHRVSTNVYDGRVYDWRECLTCDRDGICMLVHDWTGGYHDEGVSAENAVEWAEEAVEWPANWLGYGLRITAAERMAARNWIARAAGGEGE